MSAQRRHVEIDPVVLGDGEERVKTRLGPPRVRQMKARLKSKVHETAPVRWRVIAIPADDNGLSAWQIESAPTRVCFLVGHLI
jgi:hypothetical protein